MNHRTAFLFALLLLLPATDMKAQRNTQQADSLLVVKALLRGQLSMVDAASLFLGRPYIAHTLEKKPEQLIVNTRQLDCTTLVENACVLYLCSQKRLHTFADFKRLLLQLRYRNGRLDGYASRLHYFSEWITDNEKKQFVTDILSADTLNSSGGQLALSFMSEHPQSYQALVGNPTMVEEIKRVEKQISGSFFRYIHRRQFSDSLLRQIVKDGDIIAITTSKRGLDIAHLGIAVWRSDGLHLLNASQLHRKVVIEPMTLQQYFARHPSFTGIRVVRMKQPVN